MSSVPGKGGRKSAMQEMRLAELCNMAVEWAIKEWDKLTKTEKMKIVTQVAPKYIPTNISGEVNLDLNLKEMVNRVNGARERAEFRTITAGTEPGQGTTNRIAGVGQDISAVAN